MKIYTVTTINDAFFEDSWTLRVGDIDCNFIANTDFSTLDNIFPENIQKILGSLNYKNIRNNGVILANFNMPIHSQSHAEQLLSEACGVVSGYFANFFSGSWFLQDNSVHVGKTISFLNEGILISSERSDNFSMSQGKNKCDIYRKSDFEDCLKIMDKFLGNKNEDNLDDEHISLNHRKYILDPSNKNYWNYDRLDKALRFLYDARGTSFIPSKILNYMSILEVLFVTEKESINYQLKNNVTNFFKINKLEDVSKGKISNAYELRSSYVHGSMSLTRGDLEKEVKIVDDIIRKILWCIINNKDLIELFKDRDTSKLNEYFKSLKES